MENETIKALVDEYEELLTEKSRLYKATEENKQAIKDKADELCVAISKAGMKNVQFGDYTYTPGVTTKYYLIGEGKAAEDGIDRFAPFENDAYLSFLVKKDIKWQAMQKPLQEMAESEEGIPDDIKAVITSSDEFGITRRKTDTKGKDKVAAAIERREKDV